MCEFLQVPSLSMGTLISLLLINIVGQASLDDQSNIKYQFCAIHTADTTDGKVTNRALLSTESEKVHRLYLPHEASFPKLLIAQV